MPIKTIKTQAQTLSGRISDVNQRLGMWLLKQDYNLERDALTLIKWAEGAYTYEITRAAQVPSRYTHSSHKDVGEGAHTV